VTNQPLTVGSLFAGIGGFDLAAERAGLEVKWQVEIDEYCRRVLAKHWPNAKRFSDVRECGAANLTPVDVICGGFPCQDISYAGDGAGLSGSRSGLWYDFARIIRELGPRFVVVENVAALLQRGMGTVLGDLAESRYDAEWDCIPASAVGAPHRRDRVWIVAHAHEERPQKRGLHAEERSEVSDASWGSRRDEALADSRGNGLEGSIQARYGQSSCGRVFARREATGTGFSGGAEQWRVEPDVGRVAHGVSPDVDRLGALGNAIVPQVAEWIFRRILEAHGEAQSGEGAERQWERANQVNPERAI
jgi:DNA (cytosine-5)-methyltransferase 1